MCFGSYGREENTLIANYRSGGLSIKVLQRQAKLSVTVLNNIGFNH